MRGSARLRITSHVAVRMRQRGYHLRDLDAVENLGTQMENHGILLLKKDAEPELTRLNKELKNLRRQKSRERSAECELIQQIERIRRLVKTTTFIPTANGCALSIYSPCKRRLKYILHGRRAYGRRQQFRGRR
jgi:hypothetical protein